MIVAVIEPDYFSPVILGIVVAATLLYARRRFVARAATAEAG